MIASFERDLTESCEEAADFLRKKLSEWRNEISIKNEVYSGEREFVSEVYRLLIEKNGCYRDALFVDYFPYPRGNEQGENIVRLSNDEKYETKKKRSRKLNFKLIRLATPGEKVLWETILSTTGNCSRNMLGEIRESARRT